MVSEGRETSDKADKPLGLNPCSSGIWSRRLCVGTLGPSCIVLILVLVEYGLGAFGGFAVKYVAVHVLILVLVEYGLGDRGNSILISGQALS